MGQFIAERYGPVLANERELASLLDTLDSVGLLGVEDIRQHLLRDSLYTLHPPVPLAVLSLLRDLYSSRVILHAPVYGNNYIFFIIIYLFIYFIYLFEWFFFFKIDGGRIS